ncbi:alpha/beta fold hydrolase [Lentibacter sp. XHP0401]|uniref:alpha/beta fold hydrolase n=1 Tax=Lentibacter sp. XHP0401 TaxID=2984334 RepID=UPI0021E8EE6E|nr:alpha/beta fold hydrolase [Lentibacter sp. XHP0401]MCV2893847.1 alpha/beta fold hydrolase [Lentibacter sp. XHP0401]
MKPIIPLTTAVLFALPMLAFAEESTFVSDGVPLHFTEKGTGPTVVMLHAFAGSSTLWESNGLLPLDGFRAISFDARGHGASGKPADADAYGTQLVDDVMGLMDDHGIEAAHTVGYSMGAETALKLATTHPDRVLSLLIGGFDRSGANAIQTYGFIADAFGRVDTFGDFITAMAPDDEGASEEEMMAGLAMLSPHGIATDQDAAPLAATASAMHQLLGLGSDELEAIPFPVLGIAGETDGERANIERLGQAIPDFTFVHTPGADHLLAPFDPLFTETVTAFLRK